LILQHNPKVLNFRLNVSSSSRVVLVENNRISFLCSNILVTGTACLKEKQTRAMKFYFT